MRSMPWDIQKRHRLIILLFGAFEKRIQLAQSQESNLLQSNIFSLFLSLCILSNSAAGKGDLHCCAIFSTFQPCIKPSLKTQPTKHTQAYPIGLVGTEFVYILANQRYQVFHKINAKIATDPDKITSLERFWVMLYKTTFNDCFWQMKHEHNLLSNINE